MSIKGIITHKQYKIVNQGHLTKETSISCQKKNNKKTTQN